MSCYHIWYKFNVPLLMFAKGVLNVFYALCRVKLKPYNKLSYFIVVLRFNRREFKRRFCRWSKRRIWRNPGWALRFFEGKKVSFSIWWKTLFHSGIPQLHWKRAITKRLPRLGWAGFGRTENVEPNEYEAWRNKCCHLRHFRASGRATVHLKPLKSAGKMHASAGNRAAGAKPATGMNDGTIYCVTLWSENMLVVFRFCVCFFTGS